MWFLSLNWIEACVSSLDLLCVNSMNDPKNEEQDRIRVIGALMTLPFVLAVPPIIGLYAGKWLDEHFGIVLFMPLLLVLGFAAGVRECYRIIKKYGNGGI